MAASFSPQATVTKIALTKVLPATLAIVQYCLIISTLFLFSTYELKTSKGHVMFPAIHIALRTLAVGLVLCCISLLVKKKKDRNTPNHTIESSKRLFFTFVGLNLLIGGFLAFDPMLQRIFGDTKLRLAGHTKRVFYVSLIFIGVYNAVLTAIVFFTGGGFAPRKTEKERMGPQYPSNTYTQV
ncbi:hypothetical protein GGI12_000191 [Dipsacomyces acuminosporus]|nr:hypothetical protein GGI12_000191 [Dipsacomyces acuminosporus]